MRLPLVGSINKRADGSALLDQRFASCIFNSAINPALNSKTVYVQKRKGMTAVATQQAGSAGYGCFLSPFNGVVYTAYGATSTIYSYLIGPGTINCGSLDGNLLHFSEAILNGIGYLLITSSAGTGWYLPSNATAQTAYTVTTHTSTLVDGIASTTGMYAGQAVSGSGIQAGTRIASVDSANQITLTLATTTSTTTTLTKTPIAKIIDADFPANITGQFIELDGTIYIMTVTAAIRGSDINSVSSWTATNTISANIYTDIGVGLAKYRNNVLAFGVGSGEFFYNAGNASGSLLNSSPQIAFGVGAFSTNGGAIKAQIATGHSLCVWGGSDKELYTLDGFSPKKLSRPMMGSNGFANGTTDIINIENNLIIHSGSGAISGGSNFWYSPEENIFLYNGLPDTCFLSSDSSFFPYGVIGGSDTSGKLYLFSSGYQDNGAAFSFIAQTSQIDFGTPLRKFISRVTLDADTQTSGTCLLEKSDDDYSSWQTLGTFDMTAKDKFITRCGSHLGGRAYRLTHSANTAFRATALDIEMAKADG